MDIYNIHIMKMKFVAEKPPDFDNTVQVFSLYGFKHVLSWFVSTTGILPTHFCISMNMEDHFMTLQVTGSIRVLPR